MGNDFQTPWLINILRGIVPVASGWGTDPTNLERCTDGDFETVTGTGETVMGAAGEYGVLVFNLGSVKTIMASCKLGVYSSAGAVQVFVAFSDDNITYSEKRNIVYTSSTSVTEKIIHGIMTCGSGRYIKITFSVNAASTAYAKIYEIMAWELQI